MPAHVYESIALDKHLDVFDMPYDMPMDDEARQAREDAFVGAE